MKRLFLLTALTLILLAGCSKKESYQAHGILTGQDYLYCACCGGIILKIDGDPADYRIDSLGTMTWEEMNELKFPKQIKFDFDKINACGNLTHLKIRKFVLSK